MTRMAPSLGLLLLAGVLVPGGVGSHPKPCCFPDQFTAQASNLDTREWGEVTYYDFTNNRKMLRIADSQVFYYFDLESGLTYKSDGGICVYFKTPGWALINKCLPEDSQLDTVAGTVVGNDLKVETWSTHNGKVSGEFTVTQEKCYPISLSYTDVKSGWSIHIFFTSVQEGIDESVFPDDLSHCTPL